MATRIGVDIGGTFTDLVYFDEVTGRTVEGKVPTVPNAPEQGAIDAVRLHVPQSVIDRSEFFLHGTTVGLNALLERRGATVGLLTTSGFRDVLEIRRGDRAEMYNLFWRQPEPLVPRHLRLEVPERIRTDGSIHLPLDEASVAELLRTFLDAGVDSIAVTLINSFANPEHERRIEALLRDAGFKGGISLSHRISGEYREYERASTTVIDAFVRPRTSQYLQRLESRLRELGFAGSCLITRSGGGSMTFAEAEGRPFETIMSGPVGGVQGTTEVARALGLAAVITADVGGTSFDTALVLDGEPQVLFQGQIDGMPLQTAWVDVRSIGSGGGSIAYVDAGGLMRVGPRSAGALPGPAAYGKGGTEATLTDAATVLGMFGAGELASGIRLDVTRAADALRPVGVAIGRDLDATAIGVMTIAAATMANAMREVSVEQGNDPRDATLLPFGGAGPLMACLLADELAMSRIVVPRLAGNFSAWGLLGADMIRTAARTRIMPLSADSLNAANSLLDELFATLDPGSGKTGALLDLRYRGQEHWMSIDIPLVGGRIAQSAEAILEKFKGEYDRAFAGNLPGTVEIVAVRASVRVALPRRSEPGQALADRRSSGVETGEAYSFARGRRVPFRRVPRAMIVEPLHGPAVISEATTTIYLDAGWTSSPGKYGELVLTRGSRIQ